MHIYDRFRQKAADALWHSRQTEEPLRSWYEGQYIAFKEAAEMVENIK